MAVKSRIATARSIIFLTALSLVGVFLLWGCKKEPNHLPKPSPPNVTVEKVVLQAVPVHLNYVAATVSNIITCTARFPFTAAMRRAIVRAMP